MLLEVNAPLLKFSCLLCACKAYSVISVCFRGRNVFLILGVADVGKEGLGEAGVMGETSVLPDLRKLSVTNPFE